MKRIQGLCNAEGAPGWFAGVKLVPRLHRGAIMESNIGQNRWRDSVILMPDF
jgi:hypothetical protein